MKYNYFLKFIFVEYILGLIYVIGAPIFSGMLYIVFPPVILIYALGLAGFFGLIPLELTYTPPLQPLSKIAIVSVNIAFQLHVIYKIYEVIVKNKFSSTLLRIVALHHILFAGICVYGIIYNIDEILRNYHYYLFEYLIFLFLIPLNVVIALMAMRVVSHERELRVNETGGV